MENPPLLYGKDTTTGAITQIKSIGNVLLTTNGDLNSLTDVVISSATNNQSLLYNGTNWINLTIPISGCFNGYIAGAFPTVVPANATTGNLFTVPIAGNYVLNISASAYRTIAGIIQIDIWMNGVNTTYSLKTYANEINSHKTLSPISFRYALNAGNNYLYIRMISGSSDANDFLSFNWAYSPIIV